MECHNFLMEIVKKLQNKCPLQYSGISIVWIERTVVLQTIICQNVTSVGGVTNDLIVSAAGAWHNWKSFVEEQGCKKETEQQNLKRKCFANKIYMLKGKKKKDLKLT
ncbi:hypothetical protein PR048_010950 [Dryococelus australis]|uniref:Uncharacterized protein n=1 Tax=Dryococelus australis TaxID=614101 RepID=A0ABQ9HKQ3_9NEOP|nr:hypothetical protein PR048_010950 [Dryococelus australis]